MEKIEFGYTVPKERWKQAAANMEGLANILTPILMQIDEGGGQEAADELTADLILACMALHHVAEFAVDKCRVIPVAGGVQE